MIATRALDFNELRDIRRVQPERVGGIFTLAENAIYQTTNYPVFTLNELNRPIDPAHLSSMIEAIKRKNFLETSPIVVDRNFGVVDGQHRLKAAQFLGLPIYFIVSATMTMQDAAELNRNTVNWKLTDYLHYWCVAGKPDYLALRDFITECPWIPASQAASICTFGNNGHRYTPEDGQHHTFFNHFAKGHYIANDIPFAKRVAHTMLSFKHWFKSYKHTHFLRAVIQLCSNADYDHERMLMKLEYQSTKLVRCASADAYLQVLEDIYNFKVPQPNRVSLKRLYSQHPKYRVDRKGDHEDDE